VRAPPSAGYIRRAGGADAERLAISIADHVRGEDRRKPAFNELLDHGPLSYGHRLPQYITKWSAP
jgi:hypothetical protein